MPEKRKLLFVCPLESEFQISIHDSLSTLNWDVKTFNWNQFIGPGKLHKIQAEYLFGSTMVSINKGLIKMCDDVKPDVIFIYKGIYIFPRTLKKIKSKNILIVSYNPDNPFGHFNYQYSKKYIIEGRKFLSILIAIKKAIYFNRLWKHFVDCLPFYDINIVPRRNQQEAYNRIGAKNNFLIHWHYNPDLHRPLTLNKVDRKKYETDVLMIGRYEPDHRIECIETLVNNNIKVSLHGTGWNNYLSDILKNKFGEDITPVHGKEYVKAICGSKIVLNFNAKINLDTSTIKCFEIPACGSLLLSERTEEMTNIFKEDSEAVYFDDSDELLIKVKYLLSHPKQLKIISMAGHKKCISSGYDVYSRMQTLNSIILQNMNKL